MPPFLRLLSFAILFPLGCAACALLVVYLGVVMAFGLDQPAYPCRSWLAIGLAWATVIAPLGAAPASLEAARLMPDAHLGWALFLVLAACFLGIGIWGGLQCDGRVPGEGRLDLLWVPAGVWALAHLGIYAAGLSARWRAIEP